MTISPTRITVGELAVRFLEQCGTRAAFGVISIHNMPILDALHTRGVIRFVSARGEAGACNMADACARVSGTLGVCVTSTGTGSGNAAGAMVEALTAGTPMLHLTGQIESPYLDRDLGYIHEHPAQLAMLKAVGKDAFRIRNPETALATLREAVRIAQTPPCGPVSIEIPIDVQKMLLDLPADLSPLMPAKAQPSPQAVDALAKRLLQARRPLLWLGGGARGAAGAAQRLVAMGWAVVTSVQGRGIVPEGHPQSLGSYNLQKPAEDFYATVDAMLTVGSRLRSNETLSYKLRLPATHYRIDANLLAENRGYNSACFVHGDAELTLHALADWWMPHSVPTWRSRMRWRKSPGRTSGGCATSRCRTACGATVRRCSTIRAQVCMRWAVALARAWRWRLARQLPTPRTNSAARPWRWSVTAVSCSTWANSPARCRRMRTWSCC